MREIQREPFFLKCRKAMKNPQRSHFPYIVTTIDLLPELIANYVKQNLPDHEEITGIFIVPADFYGQGFRWRLNPYQVLIFTNNGIFHISQAEKQKANGTWIYFKDILKIKLSLILLYGKLEIWAVQNDKVTKIEMEYNTVGHQSLSPHLKNAIKGTWAQNPPSRRSWVEDKTFPKFINTSYSFHNGLKIEALQPGEIILGYIFQPEIKLTLMKYFHQTISPKTLLTLTNHQLILLQEDLRLRVHHEWIFTFIPRARVSSITLEAKRDFKKMSIHLQPDFANLQIDLILDQKNASKWFDCWENMS